METRVRSRFSGKMVMMFAISEVRDVLQLFRSRLELPSSFKDAGLRYKWNANLEQLLQDPQMSVLIRENYVCNDVNILINTMIWAISCVSDEEQLLTLKHFREGFECTRFPKLSPAAQGLSQVEVVLLAAAHNITVSSASPTSCVTSFDAIKRTYDLEQRLDDGVKLPRFFESTLHSAFHKLLDRHLLAWSTSVVATATATFDWTTAPVQLALPLGECMALIDDSAFSTREIRQWAQLGIVRR
eukprot:TRINITY_DN5168_c0_g1_i5.p1 TRINITY_DN5168_c0_g1~~TRINITY_DN5168_c0_g1_i5.p1  ORF type:complete len:243 (-),score=56.49 TRINITY_DN5168_c0_g1_i5:196-924(-)